MNTPLTWKSNYKLKSLQHQLIFSVIILAVVLFFYSGFLNYIETREGFSFNDPFLSLFNPINLTWLIFISIYLSLLTGIIILIRNPLRLVLALQIYTLLILVRMIAMYSVPFNPPPAMIPLNDPFVQFFGTGNLLTKDLFFSGHTATLFLLYLVIDKKPFKRIFLLLTIVVAVSVLLQHVHYFIDVFAAPFFTFGCYVIVKNVRNRYFYNSFEQ
jgi:membrane-associated phospholipid phosphatase